MTKNRMKYSVQKALALTVLTGTLATLTACSSTSDGSNALQCPNPAIPIDYPRDTLEVQDNLERYQFDDFLTGVQPSTAIAGTPTDTLLSHLLTKVQQASNFTGTAAAPESYTNSIDVLEEIIATDELSNLTTARSQMRFAIDNNIGCRYNNQSVRINDGTTALQYLVDFNFVPVTSEGNDPFVSRTIVEFGTATPSEEDPGNASNLFFSGAASLTTYDAATFTMTGYNTPRSVIASWSLAETESVTINKDYTTKKQDEVEYVIDEGVMLEGINETLKRIKFVVDYTTANVMLYTSDFKSAIFSPQGEIVKDPTTEQLEQFQAEFPDWVAEVYEDPGYDGELATPFATFSGSQVSHRQ